MKIIIKLTASIAVLALSRSSAEARPNGDKYTFKGKEATVCRGEGGGGGYPYSEKNEFYYTKYDLSLEECKQYCLKRYFCHGIEHGRNSKTGRRRDYCEIWVKPIVELKPKGRPPGGCWRKVKKEDDPDTNPFEPEEFYIKHKPDTWGNGCPDGSVRSRVSDDAQSFTLSFLEYKAEVTPYTPYSVERDCEVNIDFHVPPGWQYSIVKVGYNAKILLDEDVRVKQRSEYFFEGNLAGPVGESEWVGPTKDHQPEYLSYDDDLMLRGEGAWYPCGTERELVVLTSLEANNYNNRKGSGYIKQRVITGEIDKVVGVKYKLKWRRCDDGT